MYICLVCASHHGCDGDQPDTESWWRLALGRHTVLLCSQDCANAFARWSPNAQLEAIFGNAALGQALIIMAQHVHENVWSEMPVYHLEMRRNDRQTGGCGKLACLDCTYCTVTLTPIGDSPHGTTPTRRS